jgi:hypothetical protein
MIKDYGTFRKYDQTLVEGHLFQNNKRVICLKNAADQDWYDLRNSLASANTAKQTYLLVHPGDNMIAMATTDIDTLFPQDMQVIGLGKLLSDVAMLDATGDTWENGEIVDYVHNLTAPPPTVIDDTAPWKTITPAQGKLVLFRHGLLETVEVMIEQAVQQGDREFQIWYQNAVAWHRDNIHVQTLGLRWV